MGTSAMRQRMRQCSAKLAWSTNFFYSGAPPRTSHGPLGAMRVGRGAHSGSCGPDGRIARPCAFPGKGKGLNLKRDKLKS